MASTTAEEIEYYEALDRAIHRALRRGPLSLRQLAAAVGGAYPRDTLKRLETLVSAGKAWLRDGRTGLTKQTTVVEGFARSAGSGKALLDGRTETHELPEPHPGDFDWRFTSRTASRLSALVAGLVPEGEVCLLGAPSLFAPLKKRGTAVTLVDKNQRTASLLGAEHGGEILVADLLRDVPETGRRFSVVVADPPWYRDHYQAFVGHAARLLLDDGFLLFSLLPFLTRPSAHADRAFVVRLLFDRGFELVSVHPGWLRYKTPLFEQMSLGELSESVGDWRRADLCLFRLERRGSSRAGEASELGGGITQDVDSWRTFYLDGKQIRVRSRSTDSDDQFFFQALGEGGPQLHTVSRRNAVLDAVDVWTDRNEAWKVGRVEVVTSALELVADLGIEAAVERVGLSASLSRQELVLLRTFLRQLV